MTKKKRGIPELNLNYASLSSFVAGAGLEPLPEKPLYDV
jgi:hypothetical protein